jgi:hypothetical protein
MASTITIFLLLVYIVSPVTATYQFAIVQLWVNYSKCEGSPPTAIGYPTGICTKLGDAYTMYSCDPDGSYLYQYIDCTSSICDPSTCARVLKNQTNVCEVDGQGDAVNFKCTTSLILKVVLYVIY